MRLIIGITGASGAPLAITLLQNLMHQKNVETHLVMSKWAKTTIELETSYKYKDLESMVDVAHAPAEQSAIISYGSFLTDGMIIVPCSMRTLAGIRHGYSDGIVGRAADVILKEGRKLVLVPRETPLNTIHLENMLALSKMGVSIVPPMPAYYNHPRNINDINNHIVGRILDQFNINLQHTENWMGFR